MKILSIGLDSSILDANSSLAFRVADYGNLVEKYTVIVPAKNKKEIKITPNSEAYGVRGCCWLFKFINIYKLAVSLLNQERYDVVTSQDPYFIGLISLFLARKFKMGLEIQVHGWEKFGVLRSLIVRTVLKRADSIRVVSQRLKDDLKRKFRIVEDKIIVVSVFSEIKKNNAVFENKKKSSEFTFLTVGRLVSVKNIVLQLKALSAVIKDYPNVELHIVGQGSEKNRLEKIVQKMRLQKNVKFLGPKNKVELAQIYEYAHCFLLTSNREGWGLVVIEAANYGLPIIMTNVGCAGEVIKNEKSGLVIPVGDAVALEQAMKKIIVNENLKASIVKEAFVALQSLPTKEEILNLYKKSWEMAFKNKKI